MKKLLTIFSSLVCLFLVSNGYANPYYQPQANAYYPCAHSCVERCEEPCVGQCVSSSQEGHFYMGAFGGANWLNTHRKDGIKPKTKLGYVALLSLGYKFNNGFRLEGEVAYRRNHLKGVDTLKYSSSEHLKSSGVTYSWSYMANFLYDFDCVSYHFPNIVPYVGLGMGYTQNHAHIKAHNHQEHVDAKGRSNGMVGQAIAGVSYRLTDDTSLGIEYRYFVGREHARDHSLGLALRQSF